MVVRVLLKCSRDKGFNFDKSENRLGIRQSRILNFEKYGSWLGIRKLRGGEPEKGVAAGSQRTGCRKRAWEGRFHRQRLEKRQGTESL